MIIVPAMRKWASKCAGKSWLLATRYTLLAPGYTPLIAPGYTLLAPGYSLLASPYSLIAACASAQIVAIRRGRNGRVADTKKSDGA